MGKVRGMSTVDHEIGNRALGLIVDFLDRFPERLAARQTSVGLDRERDHARDPGVPSRASHADCLVRIGQREGTDEIRRGVRERRDLRFVVALRFLGRHRLVDAVAVTARADAAADDHLRPTLGC